MKPFEERTDTSLLSFAVLQAPQRASSREIKEGFVFALNPPSIPGHGHHRRLRVLPAESRLRRRARHRRRGRDVPGQGAAAARARRHLHHLHARRPSSSSSTSTAARPRRSASRCREAFATMQAFFGSQIAGQFSAFSRVWWVILQADASYRMQPVGLRQGLRAARRAARTCRCRRS